MPWQRFIPWINSGSVFDFALAMRSVGRARITPAVLTHSSSSTDGTSFATASITPASGVLTLLAVHCSHASAAETPNSVTGNGLTWTAVTNSMVANGTNTRRTVWFYAFGASPSAGAVTIGFATTHTGCAWSVISVPGGVPAAPRQATTNTATSAVTVVGTLAALESPYSAHFYACSHATAEGKAVPAAGSWSELSDQPTTAFTTPTGSMQVAYAIGDITADPTWATSGAAQITSIEVKAS